jgi:hypothetical protein
VSARRSRSLSPCVVFATLIVLLYACTTNGDQYREDVLYCEESVARLAECCSGFDPTRIICRYREESGGCYDDERYTYHPTLSIEESRCILGKSCGEISPAMCERALAAPKRISCQGWLCSSDGGTWADREKVCS